LRQSHPQDTCGAPGLKPATADIQGKGLWLAGPHDTAGESFMRFCRHYMRMSGWSLRQSTYWLLLWGR
jgi:hypothetical protein